MCHQVFEVIVLVLVCLPPALSIVENYTLNLTSTSPAVYGSKVVFVAEILMNTGGAPKDVKKFKYEWRRTGSIYVETTYANFNSSLHTCYSTQDIRPGKYKMKVDVFDNVDTFQVKDVAKKEIDFVLTDTLNGLLQASQNSTHKSKLSKHNTFATQQQLEVKVNLTDIFPQKPPLSYYWFINNDPLVDKNTPSLSRNFSSPGTYKVSAIAKVDKEGFQDCAGFNYSYILNGSFSADLILKDTVGEYFVFGKHETDLGSGITLTIIWQKGSGPFQFSWTVESSNNSRILNQSSSIVENTSANITLDTRVLSRPGLYKLNVSIDNAVSILHRSMLLTVRQPPSYAPHSGSVVVLSVIGGLIVMTICLVIFVKVRDYQKRQQHIETADFDFHPFLHSQRHPSQNTQGQATADTCFKSLMEKFKSFRHGDGETARNNMVIARSNSTNTKAMNDYGSLGNSLEHSLTINA